MKSRKSRPQARPAKPDPASLIDVFDHVHLARRIAADLRGTSIGAQNPQALVALLGPIMDSQIEALDIALTQIDELRSVP